MANKTQYLQKIFQKDQFPVRIVHTKTNAFTGTITISHYHAMELELQFIKRATGFYFIKDTRYPVKPFSVLIIHRYEVHHFFSSEKNPFIDKISLMLSPKIFEQLQISKDIAPIFECKPDFSHQILLTGKEFSKIEFLLNQAKEEMEQRHFLWQPIVLTSLEQIIVFLLRRMKEGDSQIIFRSEMHNVVAAAISYIEKNFSLPVTLKQVSSFLNVSQFHLSHLFTRYTGISFKTYLIRRRIEEAKKLLKETDFKVASIAHKAGFADESSFTKSFKKTTGISPSSFRKIFQ
ncbi:MAG TPA: AraC family transcriptional regulator [bacterium]|nr:AraC family transcriptional regulator [bacterium]HOL35394.1 AraC family transcriptional regulator [bacterium]HPP08742.1 AraC family transcriptional regulator [bacterium]